jgi:hypothetical protein
MRYVTDEQYDYRNFVTMTEQKPYKHKTNLTVHHPGYRDILKLYDTKISKSGNNSVVKGKREFYKKLKEKHPNLENYKDQDILQCIEGFNNFIADTIIDYRDGVQLPANMGILMVCTLGKRTDAIDHKKSAELGVEVCLQNNHSDGYGGGIYYSTCLAKENQVKKGYMYPNCQYWMMFPSVNLKQKIKIAYEENWKKYHMVPKSRRYEDMSIDSYQKQLKTRMDVKQIKDTYDEFQFPINEEDI